MDACQYESITGFKNYEGFKSLLKNGSGTNRYSCDDDTIVFNKVVSIPLAEGIVLDTNQVAVCLSYNGNWISDVVGFYPEYGLARDVNNLNVTFNVSGDAKGMVFTSILSSGETSDAGCMMLAIFDLF